MKKIIIVAIALILILAVSATSIVIAQDNSPSQQSLRLENALNQQLEKALNNGLINQELIDNVYSIWVDKSYEEQLQLYKRVVNLIQSKYKKVGLENAFFSTLEKAIELGYIAPVKYSDIVNLWEQYSPEEQQKLYDRLCNMMKSKVQTKR
jgi:predicted DNA-binding ribbon-helix-helix protein